MPHLLEPSPVLAEAVAIDGDALLLLLVVVLVVGIMWAAVLASGLVLARRAGRGSTAATGGWAVVVVLELVVLVAGPVPDLVRTPTGLALVAQVVVHLVARREHVR